MHLEDVHVQQGGDAHLQAITQSALTTSATARTVVRVVSTECGATTSAVTARDICVLIHVSDSGMKPCSRCVLCTYSACFFCKS